MNYLITKKESGKSVRIMNAEVENGKIFQTKKVGVGESRMEAGFDDVWEVFDRYEKKLVPFFCASKLKKIGLSGADVSKMTYEEVIENDKLFNCLFDAHEENEGYLVEDYDEVLRKKREQKTQETKEKIKQETGFEIDLEKSTNDEDRSKHYKVTHIESGQVFRFIDRNIEDFGRVINPNYYIDEKNKVTGGLRMVENEVPVWKDFYSEEGKYGWFPVRELTEIENKAYLVVEKYSTQSNEIRM